MDVDGSLKPQLPGNISSKGGKVVTSSNDESIARRCQLQKKKEKNDENTEGRGNHTIANASILKDTSLSEISKVYSDILTPKRN